MEEEIDIEIGHVGPPAARQFYLAPIGERAAWAIYEMTLDADRRIPTFAKLSSGHPSLVKLIPDALSIFEAELDNRVPLTITHTPVGGGREQWLRDLGDAIFARPGTTVELALPVRRGDPDLWGWAYKHTLGPGGYGAESTRRFRINTLRAQIAKLFNPPHVVSDTIAPGAPNLRDYASGLITYDIWLRPNWIGEELLPEQFPARKVHAPLVKSDSTKALLQRQADADKHDANLARRRQNDERIDKVAADWVVERKKNKRHEDAEAAREAAIERRVRAELEG